MARITTEDCRVHVPNDFELVLLAARRARELNAGTTPVAEAGEKEKTTVVALREVASGRLDIDRLRNDLIASLQTAAANEPEPEPAPEPEDAAAARSMLEATARNAEAVDLFSEPDELSDEAQVASRVA
ncbi:MAG TPA: DNA-directed RNA polymerase subunit omega [Alphaproteobacteria bacterium]